jgi:hypothetical protein
MPGHELVSGCFAGVPLKQWEHMDSQEVVMYDGHVNHLQSSTPNYTEHGHLPQVVLKSLQYIVQNTLSISVELYKNIITCLNKILYHIHCHIFNLWIFLLILH